ncbi:uncharacterized protein LOC126907282 [Daktulosphaira vitifoliae]|uniref:uncharacterized protein LOC126907282 n=1 Tax=Daktulosphaira vitifoliae TaxID=58002 RepID=UPI0021AA9C9E|nr:uncharacterized protein LOC126907282 [Daktulosphaira vitifoliae]
MAYLSNSFDFEHLQNSTNWEVIQKKRSFVSRKVHKINKVIKPIIRALCRRNAVTPVQGSALDPRGLSPEELENLQNEYIERKLSQAVVYDEDDYYSDTVSIESGLGLSFEELRQPEQQLLSLLPEAHYYMSRDFWFESDIRTLGQPSFTRQQMAQRQQPYVH